MGETNGVVRGSRSARLSLQRAEPPVDTCSFAFRPPAHANGPSSGRSSISLPRSDGDVGSRHIDRHARDDPDCDAVGRNWARVLDPFGTAPSQGCDKTGMTFFDASAGWMTRDCHGVTEGLTVESTLDGGSTWISEPLPTPAADPGASDSPNVCRVHSPRLFSERIGALAASCEQYDESKTDSDDPWKNERSYLFRTEDGGGSWTVRSYPGGELELLSPSEILALGRVISTSKDAGVSWQTLKTVAWDGHFSFVDDSYGWAVARSEGAIAFVRTINGGKTWLEDHPVIRP